MNQQTKLVTYLGILSLFISPSCSYAQRNLVKGGAAATRTTRQMSQLSEAVGRAVAERNLQLGIAGARLMTGTQAVMPPLWDIPGNVSFTELTQRPARRELVPLSLPPNDPLAGTRANMKSLYNLTEEDAHAMAAGAQGDVEAVKQAIAAGADPKFAFWGAVVQWHRALAEETMEEYGVDINAPVVDNKNGLELFSDLYKDDDLRLPWLSELGLNPDLFMTSGLYQRIHYYHVFHVLVLRGLNPMAADKNGFTALHWYAQHFVKGSTHYRGPTFVVDWMDKFPEANPNVQDIDGNTPLHVFDRAIPLAANPFLQLRGSDPLVKNKAGRTPHMGFWADDLQRFREGIKRAIIKYEYNGRELTQEQEMAVEDKAARFSLYPQELVDYLLLLGATPNDMLQEVLRLDYMVTRIREEFLATREVKEFVDILTNEHGATPLKL